MRKKILQNARLILLILFICIILIVPMIDISGQNSYIKSDQLYSGNKDNRLKVLEKLGDSDLYWSMDRVIQVMITDEEDDMRLKACEILKEKKPYRAIPSFTYAIDDENIHVRICAIRALAFFIDDFAIEKLIERLKVEDNDIYGINKDYYEINLTSHYNVRKEIVKTLATITRLRKKPSLRNRVIKLLKKHYDVEEDWGVRIQVLDSILMLNRDEGFEMLKYALANDNELYLLNWTEAKLREIGRGAHADKILAERQLFRERIAFINEVKNLNDEQLKKFVWRHRYEYLAILKYGVETSKRFDAAIKLGLVGNGEIIDTLEFVLKNDPNIDVRNGCVMALGDAGNVGEPNDSVKALIEVFYKEDDQKLKTNIIKALAKLGVDRSEY